MPLQIRVQEFDSPTRLHKIKAPAQCRGLFYGATMGQKVNLAGWRGVFALDCKASHPSSILRFSFKGGNFSCQEATLPQSGPLAISPALGLCLA